MKNSKIVLTLFLFIWLNNLRAQQIIWKESNNFITRTNSIATGNAKSSGDAYVLSESVLTTNQTGHFILAEFSLKGSIINSSSKTGDIALYLTTENSYSLADIAMNSYSITYSYSKNTIDISSPEGHITTLPNITLSGFDTFKIEKTDVNKIKLYYNNQEFLVTDNFIGDLRVAVRAQVNSLSFYSGSLGFVAAPNPDNVFVSSSDDDKNWVWSRTFDNTGTVTSTGIAYFDDLGKPTQNQTRDFKTGKNWASEVRYDAQGRPALQTMSAPINGVNQNFNFSENFIKKENGSTYQESDFETNPENPAKIGTQTGSLGHYYSNSNSGEPLQDEAEGRPYSRTIYDELNPGNVRAVVGGKTMDVNGNNQEDGLQDSFPQGFSYTMPAAQELYYIFGQDYFFDDDYNANHPAESLGKKVLLKSFKTVSVDVDGVETVVFTDADGKVLAAGRSGGENSYEVKYIIGEQGYIDIHFPVNMSGPYELFGWTGYEIYDLRNGVQLANHQDMEAGGFYRISHSTEVTEGNTYIKLNGDINRSPSTKGIKYNVNYYDFAVNYYDDVGRLTKSTQPIGFNEAMFDLSTGLVNHTNYSIYNYNAAGELLDTWGPDEGFATFAYREDGQIRFSRNSKQIENNEFSYTNYDDKARPIESGVSVGSVPFFETTTIIEPFLETYSNTESTAGTVYKINTQSNTWSGAGFHSNESTGTGNFEVTFKNPTPTTEVGLLFGLSESEDGSYFGTVDKGLYFFKARIYFRIQGVGNGGVIAYHDPNATYTIKRINGVLYCLQNDTVIYTQNERQGDTKDYIIDGAIFSKIGLFNDIKLKILNNTPSGVSVVDVDSYEVDPNQCTEQVFTQYDTDDHENLWTALYGTSTNPPPGHRKQEFLAGNVSKTWTENPQTSTTWYSYDIYGRVTWMVQFINGLGVKTIDYEYDDGTGQVSKVIYQKEDAVDRFVHKYLYNKVGQLVTIETSRDNSSFIEHARYFYYETGALKRVEVAEGLQGLDYVYTLNGQLKAINHPGLSNQDDPGDDQNDAFGLVIDYHKKDYTRANTGIEVSSSGIDQYDGNIKGLRWATTGLNNGTQNGYLYEYNEYNWLTGATFGTVSNNNYVANHDGDYNVFNISYDKNGNIKRLDRNKFSFSGPGDNAMDKLKYHYYENGNKLNYVEDTSGNTEDDGDIKTQLEGNYIYNSIGQLIENKQDELVYEYYTNGLVKSVKDSPIPGTNRGMFVEYNDRGHRVRKYATDTNGNVSNTTYYVRDASGQVMAIYNNPTDPVTNVAFPIYGLSRLGMATQDNIFKYEITDHLGNVRAVIMRDGSVAPVLDEDFNTMQLPPAEYIRSNTQLSIVNDPWSPNEKKLKAEVTSASANHLKIPFQAEAGHTYAIRFETDLEETTNELQYKVDSGPQIALINYNTAQLSGEYTFNFTCLNTETVYLTFNLTDSSLGNIENNYYIDNVRINDVTTENAPVMLAHKDYYPFGMPMPQRNIEGQYPYAYQGQEKDAETGMEAFELRLWDARLGRWLTTDPYGQYASPYLGMGNNPISRIDPDGGFDDITIDGSGNVINIVDTDSADRIFNEQGELIFDGFTRDGQFMESFVSVNGIGMPDFKGFNLGENNFRLGADLFKALTDNTNVEWSFNQYDGGNYVHSSGSPRSVSNFPDASLSFNIDVFNYSRWTTSVHSHKGGDFRPSNRMGEDGKRYGDIPNLEKYRQRGANNLKSFIYTPNAYYMGYRKNTLLLYGRYGRKTNNSFVDAVKLHNLWF